MIDWFQLDSLLTFEEQRKEKSNNQQIDQTKSSLKTKLKEKNEEKHAKDINKFNDDLKSGISGDVANKMGKLNGRISI